MMPVRPRSALVLPLLLSAVALSAGLSGPRHLQAPRAGRPGAAAAPGVSPGDWQAIRAAHEKERYRVLPASSGATRWQAANPRQAWRETFDGRGVLVEPDAGGWRWGLSLRAYGRDGAMRNSPNGAAMTVDGGRATYHRAPDLDEWFVNDARGLEHGFMLRDRPAGGAEPVRLSLAVDGGLTSRVSSDGRAADFADARGSLVLTYGGLRVDDADGRPVPATLAADRRGLAIVVDDRAARYPLVVDPMVQRAYVKASNTGFGDNFGTSVAMSGDTVVVGAYAEKSNATGVNGNQSDNSAQYAGAAYVFVRTAGVWSQQAYLKASNTGAFDYFGWSVAISGDTIVVGAYGESSAATGVNGNQTDNTAAVSGAAYVFVRNAGVWTQQAYLKASNTAFNFSFGYAVDVSGNTIAVGSKDENSHATGINGNQGDHTAPNSGAVYVFTRTSGVWTQQAYIKQSNTESGDLFGWSLALSGDTLAVGADSEYSAATGINGNQGDNSASHAGAVYVYTRSGTTWSQQAYVKASNTNAFDYFGYSIDIDGDTMVVGAEREASAATGVGGNQADNSAGVAGAAYVFTRTGTTWSQQAYVKASNTDPQDYFGESVAVAGDLLAVGAIGEASQASGVDGNQSDNMFGNAGAVYVFGRAGATWTQLGYLKGSSPDPNDFFGTSVAIAGDTVVGGAVGESSAATGIDGNPTNDAASGSGAVFIHGFPTTLAGTPLTLYYGATKSGAAGAIVNVTPAQTVTVTYSGVSPSWTAAANDAWLQVVSGPAVANGSGIGQFNISIINPGNVIGGATSLKGTVTISAPGAAPLSVRVVLTVNQVPPTSALAFGRVDTPVQNAAGLQGAIGLTGWALDDVAVSNIRVYRTCLGFDNPASCQLVLGNNVVFVGNAGFVAGARPDVEAAFPTYPLAYRAGWGLQILSNQLPHVPNMTTNGGQGTMALYAVATDAEGHQTLLGRSSPDHTPTTVTLNNDAIAKPFGTLDTPAQGATVSGNLANFGWALTPDSNLVPDGTDILIPTNGSTITVFIDGVAKGTVAYNQCRGNVGNPVPPGVFCNDDVASIFGNATPQAPLTPRGSNPTKYRNLDAQRGAIGAFNINTLTLTNGVHTIAWSVTDSAARADGVGSRFFTVLNGSPITDVKAVAELLRAPAVNRGSAAMLDGFAPEPGTLVARTGFDPKAPYVPTVSTKEGVYSLVLEEMGRLEVLLGPMDAGYLVVGGQLRDLPIGSHLDPNGTFTWNPPVGYFGTYRLVFTGGGRKMVVDVTVAPRGPSKE